PSRVIPGMIFHGLCRIQSRVKYTTATVSTVILMQNFLQVSTIRHAYPVAIPDGRSTLADHDKQGHLIFTPPLIDDNAVLAIAAVDPLRSAKIKRVLIQCLLRTIKPVQIFDKFLYTLVEVVLEQVPVETVVVIPLRCLSKLSTHEQQFGA